MEIRFRHEFELAWWVYDQTPNALFRLSITFAFRINTILKLKVIQLTVHCFAYVWCRSADPFQSDLPEVIEEYLDQRWAKCMAFNRRGTLLAGAVLPPPHSYATYTQAPFLWCTQCSYCDMIQYRGHTRWFRFFHSASELLPSHRGKASAAKKCCSRMVVLHYTALIECHLSHVLDEAYSWWLKSWWWNGIDVIQREPTL